MNLDYIDLINIFKELGIKKNLLLNVHSSLSAPGYINGGANSVISALQNLISEQGIIMMPTFTYGIDIFNANTSISKTGKITEVFRLKKGVVRSLHPTHSFAIWGKNNRYYYSNHLTYYTFGVNCPLYKLAMNHGYILLFGVDHTANSLIHCAQDMAKVKYLERPKIVKYVDLKTNKIKQIKVLRAGCSLGFGKIKTYIEKKMDIVKLKLGNTILQYFSAYDFLKYTVDLLKEKPDYLFCDSKECFSCNEAKNML